VKRNHQLTMGIQTEKEHRGTYKFIKHYFKLHKQMPPENLVYQHIAKEHIKEHPKYYTKLREVKL